MSKHNIIYTVIDNIIKRHIPEESILKTFIVFSIIHMEEYYYMYGIEKEELNYKQIYSILVNKIDFINKNDSVIDVDSIEELYNKTLMFFIKTFKNLMFIEGYDLSIEVCTEIIKSCTKEIINRLKELIEIKDFSLKEYYAANYN